MSDQINSLIHTNAVMAFQQGEKTEQQRIIKLLEIYDAYIGRDELIEAIKGEQK